MANLNENKLITLGNLKRYTENVIDLIDEVKLTAGANIKITSGGVISALGYKLDTSNGDGEGVTMPKNSIAIGVLDSFEELNNEKNEALGVASFSQGYVTTALTTGSHSEGIYTLASGIGSHAEGYASQAMGGYGSHAEGQSTKAIESFSHSEGISTTASSIGSHAEGNYTQANGDNSHAEGNGTQANGDNSHAEGIGTQANGDDSHAEGLSTVTKGANSHAEGQSTITSGVSSHAEGIYTRTLGAFSHSEGTSTTAHGISSHAEGYGTIAYNPYSHAEGQYNISGGSYIHVIGNGDSVTGVRSNAHTMDILGNSRNAGDVYGGVVWNNNGTVKSYNHALSEKLDISDISGSALSVLVDGVQTGGDWKPINNNHMWVEFKHGPGINIRANGGTLTFSTDCNHTVAEKTQVVVSEHNSTFYKLDVVCDLAGGNMTAVDLSDLADEKCIYPENKYRSFKWHKSSSEVDKYAGIVFASSIDGNFVFKLNIQNTLDSSNESHLYGFIVDTPDDTTFTFATTNSWPIEIRVDSNNRLYAYLKIPDKFAGEIELIPLRSKIRSGAWMSSFYISNGTINSLPWSGDPVTTGNVVTSEFEYPLISKNEIYGNVITSGIRTPYGNYLVDVIADFGGGLVVGDKIADDVINDYLIHTIQKRLKQHIDECTKYNTETETIITGCSKTEIYTLFNKI